MLSQWLASNERSSEAGRLHAIPEADCGTEVTSLLHSCRGTCFKKSPSGSGWPLAQVLFSAASSVHLAPHLKLSIFWPGSGLRAMRLGRPHEVG